MAIVLWVGLTILSIAVTIILTAFRLIPKWVYKIITVIAVIFAIRNSAVIISTYSELKQYYALTHVKVETLRNDTEKYQEYIEQVKATNAWVKEMKDKVDTNAPVFFKDKLKKLKEIEY